MSKRVDKVVEGQQEESPIEDVAAQESRYIACILQFAPIKSYGEEVRVIKMRKPNGNDLLNVGNPVIFYPHVEPPRIEFDNAKLLTMIARLSEPSIPTPSLTELDPRDMLNIGWELAPFFTPARSRQI